jgi:hypothetical protein
MLNSALCVTLPHVGCHSIDPLTLFIVFVVFFVFVVFVQV